MRLSPKAKPAFGKVSLPLTELDGGGGGGEGVQVLVGVVLGVGSVLGWGWGYLVPFVVIHQI